MSVIVLDDCLTELYEAEKCLDMIQAIDSYSEIFEASSDKVKETVENNEFDTQQYLESMEAELFGDDDEVETESVTPEEYLESLENELFGDDETDVEESSDDNEDDSDYEPTVQVSSRPGSDLVMTLESLEKELFGDEEEVAEESEGLTVDEYLDKLEDEYLQ